MNRISGTAAAGLLLYATLLTNVNAQDTGPHGYVGVGLGVVDASGDFRNRNGGGDTQVIFAGYRFSRHFAVELNYADMGDYERDETNTFELPCIPGNLCVPENVYTYNRNTRVSRERAGLSLLGAYPLNDRFELVGLLGRSRYRDDTAYTYTYTSPGNAVIVESSLQRRYHWVYGAGLQYNFTAPFAMRLQWEKNVGGDSVLDTGSLWLGVQYRFGERQR